jgi:hypothetical protein
MDCPVWTDLLACLDRKATAVCQAFPALQDKDIQDQRAKQAYPACLAETDFLDRRAKQANPDFPEPQDLKATAVLLDSQDSKASPAFPVYLDSPDSLAPKASLDYLDSLDQKANLATPDSLASPDYQDQKVTLACPDFPAPKDCKDLWARLDPCRSLNLAKKAIPAYPARLAFEEKKDCQVWTGLQVCPEFPDFPAPKENPDTLEAPDLNAKQANQAFPDFPASKDNLDLPGPLDFKEILDLPDQLIATDSSLLLTHKRRKFRNVHKELKNFGTVTACCT